MLAIRSIRVGLFFLAAISCSSGAVVAQRLRVGLTGAITRSFADVLTFSDGGVSSHGQPAYTIGAKGLYQLTPHWQLTGELRYNRFKTQVTLEQIDTPSVRSSITWQGLGGFAQMPMGIVYSLKPQAKVSFLFAAKAVVGVGISAFDQQSLAIGGYDGTDGVYHMPRSVSVDFTDLTEYPAQVQLGLEVASGVRLTKGIELNALYYYSVSKFRPINYLYKVDYTTTQGRSYSSRTSGFIRGRPSQIAGELVIYFN